MNQVIFPLLAFFFFLVITKPILSCLIESRTGQEEFEEFENTFDIVGALDDKSKGSSKSNFSDELSSIIIQLESNYGKHSPCTEENCPKCRSTSADSDARSRSMSSFDRRELLQDALKEPGESDQIIESLLSSRTESLLGEQQEENKSPGILNGLLNSIMNESDSSDEIDIQLGNNLQINHENGDNSCHNFDSTLIANLTDNKKPFELPNANQTNQFDDKIYAFFGMLLNLMNNSECPLSNIFVQFKQIQNQFKLENSSNLLNILTSPIITSIPTDEYLKIIFFCISNYRTSFSSIFFEWFTVIRQLSSAPIIIDQVIMKEQILISQIIQVEQLELEREFKIDPKKESFLVFYHQHLPSHSKLIERSMDKLKLIIEIKNSSLVSDRNALLNNIVSFINAYGTISGFILISLLKYDLVELFRDLVDSITDFKCSNSIEGRFVFVELEPFWLYFVKNPSLLDTLSIPITKLLGQCPLELLSSLSKFCIIPSETRYLQILISLCANREYAIISLMSPHQLGKFSSSFINWLTASFLKDQHLITKIILDNLPSYRHNFNHFNFNLLLDKITTQNLLGIVYDGAQRYRCIELAIELKKKIDFKIQRAFFRSTDSLADLIETSAEYDLFVDNLLVQLAGANQTELKRMADYLKKKNKNFYSRFVEKTGIEV